jgi:D-alanyl-D-alanine carboxypeptidase (penicillin-binding protein 5/6)
MKLKQEKVMRTLLYLMVLALFLSSAADASAAVRKNVTAGTVKKRTAKRVVSPTVSRVPYIGAIVVEAAGGRVLFNDDADAVGYPASVVKLMNLLIILEKVQQGTVKLTDRVTVTAEAAKVGGSQAYLKIHETFSIDDLLYALMVKSANDAAAALAIHLAGSQEAFVLLMNRKAQQLGMTSTQFHSVHGLTLRREQPHDVSTARDLSLLAGAVLKYPDALRYTATKHYAFRNGTFRMRNHNHLLGVVEGCDGLKTGYFAKAGYSIVATAQRDNVRIIAVVLGSRSRQWRDFNARELLANGFSVLLPPAVAVSPNAAANRLVARPVVPSVGGFN